MLWLCALLAVMAVSSAEFLAPISISVITFNDDGGVLFVADSLAAMIYAYPAAPQRPYSGSPYWPFVAQPKPVDKAYNLRNIDTTIANLLGTVRSNIFVKDMAVHPVTKEAYIAVERVQGKYYVPAVVIMNSNGQARIFNLNGYRQPYRFIDGPKEKHIFWKRVPIQTLTFTDMEFYKGKLYIAGMSNGDFASTFRAIDYPFTGYAEAITVEMYHAAHGQNETRAPIRTFKIVEVGGEDHVIAAYTCTPLVAFPLADVRNGQHITAKTIGELGYGNTPVDMLQFDAKDFSQNTVPTLFLMSKERSSSTFKMSDIEESIGKPGILSPSNFGFLGPPSTPAPITNVLQIDEQDDSRLLAVRREIEYGTLSLMSYSKGLYFRLSDFISEYEMPKFEYNLKDPMQQSLQTIQNGMAEEEGFEAFGK